MGEPSRWRRLLDQSPLGFAFSLHPVPEDSLDSLVFLPAAETEEYPEGSCVAIIRTADEFTRNLRDPAPGVEWLQVEGLLGDPAVWAIAAQGSIAIPLDVVLDDPAAEFSSLYRLVDVAMVRSTRVTIPAKPGFLKALRLAISLRLPVRLLPGQPKGEILVELVEAARFYLHDAMVETPVEFFHSLLAQFRGMATGTIWSFLEQDPAVYVHHDADGKALHPADFVGRHLEGLISSGAECAACRWQAVCAGYFKFPDSSYECADVKVLLAEIEETSEEITRELARHESTPLT